MGDSSHSNVLGGYLQAEPDQTDAGESEKIIAEAWRKSNLLVLDGGGIRGYWSLLVLKKLMELIADLEQLHDDEKHSHSFAPFDWPGCVSQIPLSTAEKRNLELQNNRDSYLALDKQKRFLPCHYFDYIGGSSTGGLITIMLGRLRMTVPDCLAEYEKLGERVFGNPRTITELNFGFVNRTKYDADNLKKIYQSVTERRGERTNKKAAPTFETNTHTCRCFVTTLRSVKDKDNKYNRAKPYLIRSYNCKKAVESPQMSRNSTLALPTRAHTNHSRNETEGPIWLPPPQVNDGDAHDFEIWEVARAATAARYFFDPVEIYDRGRHETMIFEDGGLGHSINPTNYGLSDIRMRHGPDAVGIVVSVGTARGELGKQKDPFRFKNKVLDTVEIGCDPRSIHDLMDEQSRQQPGFQYYRFNPDDSNDDHLLNMPFDQWLPRHSLKGEPSGSKTLKTIKDAFNSWWSSDNSVADYFGACAENLVHQRRLRVQDRNKWERYAMATAFTCRQKFCNKQDRTWTDVSEFDQHLRNKHKLQGRALEVEKTKAASPWQYREAQDAALPAGNESHRRVQFKPT